MGRDWRGDVESGTGPLRPSLSRHGVSLLGLPSDALRQLAETETPCGDRTEAGLSALGASLLVLATMVPLGLWLMSV